MDRKTCQTVIQCLLKSIHYKTAGIVLAVLYLGQLQAQITSWEVFNVTNSPLPDNRVYAVHVDPVTGALWAGTDNGLARYEGSIWTVWDSTNSPLPDNSVRSIQTDGSGGTWVGTFAGGLAWFKDTTWVIYDPTNSPMTDYFVRSLALDQAGGLWIGTTAGLLHKVALTWQVYNTLNSDLHSNNIASLFSTGADTVWVGTINGGLMHISGEDWFLHTIATTGIGDNSTVGVVEDRNHWVWISTPAGEQVCRNMAEMECFHL
jgi:ligand-binding sensor domain-containing protein